MVQERGLYLLSNGTSYHLITNKPLNKLQWIIFVRLNKVIAQILRHRLQTKTLSDHEVMAGLSK